MFSVIFIIYLIFINFITFLIFGLDKYLAIKQKRRIRVITLFCLSFFGGEIGGMIGMKLFHHKTNKTSFRVLLPLIFLFHIIILFYVLKRLLII